MNSKNDFTVLCEDNVLFVGSVRTSEKVYEAVSRYRLYLIEHGYLDGSGPALIMAANKYII